MCLLLLLLLLRCCSLNLKIQITCCRLRLTPSNCQTLNPHLNEMQGSWWYLFYKSKYSPFCRKRCCQGNKGRSGKLQLAAIDGLSPKTPYRRKNLAKVFYASQIIANFVQNFVAMTKGVGREKCNWMHSMAHTREAPIVAKISQKYLTQAEL